MAAVQIRVLGPFEVVAGDRPVSLTSGRLRTVLATLAMSAGEFTSVEAIGTAVWGRDLPADLRSSVQTYIARLRRLLGAEMIATRSGGYELRVDPDQVDARRFIRLSSVAPGDPDEYQAVVAALRLVRGTPFEDVVSEWLAESEAPRLVERYLVTFERRVDLDLAAGRTSDLVPELREMTARHPLHEPLWARLIVALDRSGRRAEALDCYQAVRERIAEELGVEPGAELRRLHAGLLAADAGTDLLPAEKPRQLPPDIAYFTGRSGVLAALDELAESGGAGRPVVVAALHGAGGIGKSAAVVHWAHRVRHRFPDGQLFVDLRGYGPGRPLEPAAALDSMLRNLGVGGGQLPETVDGRSALLRSLLADRQMLLVLDNARNPEQVRPLLPGSSNLVVITSRNQLRGLVARDGAHRVTVDEFTVSESVGFLATALRAQRTPYDVATLTELAALCGHLPLALAIAAEHAGRGNLAAMAAELRERRDRLGALDAGSDPASSLRTVFSWSVRALEPDSARTFRLLGLHPGADLSAAVAAALVGTPLASARRLLDRLVEAHLLEQRRPGRYQLHDLLRAYAAELAGELETGADRRAAVARMLEFYVHSAANARIAIGRGVSLGSAGPVPDGVEPVAFDDERQAFAWFDAERAGLVTAVEVAAATGHESAAYRLAEQMSSYLVTRFAVDDLLRSQRVAIEATRRVGDVAAEAVAANKFGSVLRLLGDYEGARSQLEHALTLFAAAGDDRGQASVLANLGTTLQALHQLGLAVERHLQGLAIARRVGEPDAVVLLLNNLAMSYLLAHRYDDAVDASEQALEITRSRHFRHAAPHLWDTYGQALAGRGDYLDAIEAYRRALDEVRELGDHWGEAIVLNNLGAALRDGGRPDDARASWQQALRVVDLHGIADSQELRRADLVALLADLAPATAG